MVDSCIYALRSLREVLAEKPLPETREAFLGRAYARQTLFSIAKALEEIRDTGGSNRPTDAILMKWIQGLGGEIRSLSDNPTGIPLYIRQTATVCMTEAQLSENHRIRTLLSNTATVLVQYAEWVTIYEEVKI